MYLGRRGCGVHIQVGLSIIIDRRCYRIARSTGAFVDEWEILVFGRGGC